MLKVALSHDIDRVSKTHQYLTKTISHLTKLNGKGLLNQFKSIGINKPYWTFAEFIEIENRFNIRSTVFFLNESIRLNPLSLNSYKLSMGRYNIHDPRLEEMIRQLDRNGWEIGVHGSYNSFNDINLLKQEKHTLEKIVGHRINGIRQHYLNLSKKTWKFQADVGFKYDSSWGYTDDIGFKNNRYLPFHPFNNQFKVIPLTIMDSCFMAESDRWVLFERLLDKCELKGAIMVINFHQHVFSKYDYPGYKDAYVEIIERALDRNAQFYTLGQI